MPSSCQIRLSSPKADRIRVEFGRHGAEAVSIWTTVPNLGQLRPASGNLVRSRPNFDGVLPSLARFRPVTIGFGSNSTKFDQHVPRMDQTWPAVDHAAAFETQGALLSDRARGCLPQIHVRWCCFGVSPAEAMAGRSYTPAEPSVESHRMLPACAIGTV